VYHSTSHNARTFNERISDKESLRQELPVSTSAAKPQLSFDFDAKPRHNRKATSRAAAESIRPFIAGKRERVYRAIEAAGTKGATREEIADATGMPLSSVCGRVNELLAKYLKVIGERKTKYGKPAEVLGVT
jgi:DNA-directed RNA polymerase specialized sigma24 family protein